MENTIKKENTLRPRPRQEVFIDRTMSAILKHKNTLAIAPTGFGKSVCIALLLQRMIEQGHIKTALILQHRDELTTQNKSKFEYASGYSVGVVNGKTKDWHAITFGMVQTIQRRLSTIPPFDLLVVDETHHIIAEGYVNTLTRLKHINPDMGVVGLTATPERGDSKGLRKIFSNIADQVHISELIKDGLLARPRIFVKDLTAGKMQAVKQIAGEYDMTAVESLMNTIPINEKIFKFWWDLAKDRKTVIFCSTVKHAESVKLAFSERNISAGMVDGKMKRDERESLLKMYAENRFQVIVNVAVLTEGWDDPETSCVVLLRPSSHKGLYIQMVGRGLRTHQEKKDCLVLDFGGSSLKHGDLDQDDPSLEDREKKDNENQLEHYRHCQECGSEIPITSRVCMLCGASQYATAEDKTDDYEFRMNEIPSQTQYGLKNIEIIRIGNKQITDLARKEDQPQRDPLAIARFGFTDSNNNRHTVGGFTGISSKTNNRYSAFWSTFGGDGFKKYTVTQKGKEKPKTTVINNGDDYSKIDSFLKDQTISVLQKEELASLSCKKGKLWHKKQPTEAQTNFLKGLIPHIKLPKLYAYEAAVLIGYITAINDAINLQKMQNNY